MKNYLYFKFLSLFIGISLIQLFPTFAIITDKYVVSTDTVGAFPLIRNGKPVSIYVSEKDFAGVNKVALHLQNDIKNVCGNSPALFTTPGLPKEKKIVLIGTIGKNKWIDQLILEKKIDVAKVEGKWETFCIQAVENPFAGVESALVIIGSDKRGTIFGMYDLAEQIGVSPWYWWADVPVKKSKNIFVLPGQHSAGTPKVKYRGIFINDEAPALTGWATKTYGGFNHQFYDKVFELILRLKGNYLWPAMWGGSLFDDDPLSDSLANVYGVVLGTSHHEPLMRAHAEWSRYGEGSWNYEKNKDKLQHFWREGIRRMGNKESIVTIGMRGDGDEPMSDGTAIGLLENIVADQRKIIAEETGRNAKETPQMWALYKEVQDYYDGGMRVPNDVTLLLCDDNWGNLRVLPKVDSPKRTGGYGIYYHFDFVGGPRSYRWLNTISIPRVWEQMHLAYAYGVDQIWLVNVGDIKPMELPISFFLDYAWNPNEMPVSKLDTYTENWAKQQFGEQFAPEIGRILNLYTKYNSRRKPESLFSDTYSLGNYREYERVVDDYNKIEKQAREIYDKLLPEQKDAFYQVVYQPVQACSNLYNLYYYHAKNLLYAKQGRTTTNLMAQKVKECFKKDAEITNFYHHELANGKWDFMMAQNHIGYNNWNEPKENKMPEVKELGIPQKGHLVLCVEGSDKCWPTENTEPQPLAFDSYNKQGVYIELFNTGKLALDYKFKTSSSWINITEPKGTIDTEKRFEITIDWEKIKPGEHEGAITVSLAKKKSVIVKVKANNYKESSILGFVETNGYVSMEASNYTKKNNTDIFSWVVIPGLGRTKNGVTSMPVTEKIDIAGGNTPSLEYSFYLTTAPKNGQLKLDFYFSPTLNFLKEKGLCFAVSIDDEKPQRINIHEGTEVSDWKYPDWWNNAVLNNIMIKSTTHKLSSSGQHTLKYWLIDPGIVLQKIVIDNGGVKPSYLGAPESFFKEK